MTIKDLLEYIILIGPFWLIGISLFGMLLILALKTNTIFKVLILTSIFLAGMQISYSIATYLERQSMQFKYRYVLTRVVSHLCRLADDNSYKALALKLQTLKEELPKALIQEDRLSALEDKIID